ncbi:type VII secretion-associated serine protease mycosin [Streptomyces sp. 11x1]|uniref:type VII secretion-associated serine protease mycosin n=1 Tax=Streptomyces sp. 11x1 TaxID=3038642 RepID=UPI00292F7B4A|nr:type VII secretion-associated serine protease mycosin [Streptomyces sp. 11x1]WNZ08285.1 type VII secretion-associated serine protease mycosin [Streptomyces sp. 11x1]
MRTSGKRALQDGSAVSIALGLLLVGIASTPAHAESVRDRQWHLDAMHAEEMWKTSTGRGITVAVIDSGVDDSTADLKGQVLAGKDYSDLPGDEHTDRDRHGTGVAALIAATGARGTASGSYGIAPGAKILPIRMRYSTEDYGKVDVGAEYSRKLSEAIRYAADSKAQIINISMARADSPGAQNVGTPALASAVKYALTKGKLIFAGAGNSGDTSNFLQYPAATPGVVAVAAIDKNVERSTFSQWGPQIDVAAPGEEMVHACTGGTQICKSDGTSDATAIASASAALIWSKHPTWTNNQVLRVLINTMKGNEKKWTWNNAIGYGIVRPRIALQNPGDPGPADEYPLPDLTAAASPSPSPEPSKSSGSSSNDKKDDKPTAAAPPADDSNPALWIALGVGAAALLGTAVAVPVIRARRRRPAPLTVPPPPIYAPQHHYPPDSPVQSHGTGSPSEGPSSTGRHY